MSNSEYLRSIFELAHDYNENQRLFNNNMRRLILLMNRTNIDENFESNNRNTAAASASNLFNRYQPNYRFQTRNAGANTTNQLEDSILSYIIPFYNLRNLSTGGGSAASAAGGIGHSFPSSAQLEREIENYTYVRSDENSAEEDICPISMELFQDGMPLSRIRHCGHVFKRDCLERWFANHNMCPVCRYNICANNASEVRRNAPPATAAPPTVNNIESTSDAAESGFVNLETPANNRNLLFQILNMLDISGATATSATSTPLSGGGQILNLLYEFEAPINNITSGFTNINYEDVNEEVEYDYNT